MAHGIEPVLPFDITLATFLVPNLTDKLSTADLIATRTRQLLRREDDLAVIHKNVLKSRFESVRVTTLQDRSIDCRSTEAL